MPIRDAAPDDVADMVALAEARRRQYECWQPVFWKKAENSADVSVAFLGQLVVNPAVITRVAVQDGRLDGFLIAWKTPSPPVYAPGGDTFTVDDFCVRAPELWPTVGRALWDDCMAIARTAGWRQVVVVSGHLDAAKTAMLSQTGLTIASNWWTLPIEPQSGEA
jgi:hypothetical protein